MAIGVVIVLDLEYDSVDDIVRIFYEYYPGGSVASLLKSYGAFEEKLVKDFIRQVLEVLDQLHEQRCYPSNVSTANIHVLNDGRIKLSDFGISPETKSCMLVVLPALQSI